MLQSIEFAASCSEEHMTEALRLLCVLAHPGDESRGVGGTLAKYAAEGIATYLVTATRGEHGWQGDAQSDPGPEVLGQTREAELRAAAKLLGLRGLKLLNCVDGELARAEPPTITARIARQLRQLRPQVVIIFGPDGATGHPDHIAISQFTTAAVVSAADPDDLMLCDWMPHRVTKLYYVAESKARVAAFNAVFGDTAMTVDGAKRHVSGWDDWMITTRVDASDCWQQVWRAVACHRSQLPHIQTLAQLSEAQHRTLWGVQEYYRVFSLVNGGRKPEHDLFAGLR